MWKNYRRFVQITIILIFMAPLLGSILVIGNLNSSTIIGISLSDPLALLEVGLAANNITTKLLLSSLMILTTYMILGKVFCSWVCPIGLTIELIHKVKLGKKNKSKNLISQKQYYWSLPIFILVSFIIGVPIFQTTSPIGIFFRAIIFGLGLEIILVLVIIIVEFTGIKRGWCRIFCPLGAFYALIARSSFLGLRCDAAKCSNCQKCIKHCMYTADSLAKLIGDPGVNTISSLCTRCGQCIDICPTKALSFVWNKPSIFLKKVNEVAATSELVSSRRNLFRTGGLLTLTGIFITTAHIGKKVTPIVLRPPGAGTEPEFLARCIRCGQCIEICPDKTLLSAHAEHGLGLGAPYFIPRKIPCSLCMECPNVCPTGALTPINIREVKIGIAVIDKKRCYAYQKDICRSCYNNCPLIDEAIIMEDFQYPVINTDKCTGCGICEYVCVMEKSAITIKSKELL